MDEINEQEASNQDVIARKAWTAYVWPTSVTVIVSAVMGSFDFFLGTLPVLYFLYSIFMIRSYKLYINNEGVWIYSGIFPWNKGSNGVKWRDLDSAIYYTGFLSWAFKSYRMMISHRFTKDNEIFLTHMWCGDQAVMKINSLHHGFVESK